jgi:hypothetical protein
LNFKLGQQVSPQEGYWSFRDHKERVTEVEVPPEADQRLGEITSRGWPDMPQMTILFLDRGPGEKGRTETQAPL